MESKTSERKKLLSKIATGNGHGEDSPYFDGWKAYDKDPFHPTNNPRGVIQMGLAENQLCFDLIEDWVSKNPEASICTIKGVDEFKEIAIFQDYHGLPEFRQAIANFMGKVRGNKVKFDPDRIVMSGGATGAHEMIAFCLADPGEALLVPTPYYPGFDRDLRWRTGVQLVPVHCDGSNDFKITRPALEEAYKRAKEDNIKVKGLLITNPSNPLGTIMVRETLKDILSFINEKNIHLVCDEIYAATVFSQPGFVSISEVLEEDPKCNRDLVHVVYSLSKDMGFPGFRVGIVYSYNDAVVSCARKMSSFGLVSSQTQHLIASMLSDDQFVDNERKQLLSKIATGNGHGEDSSYFHGWKAYDKDPFHPTNNPRGVIQKGLAENQLCFDLIEDWVLNNPEASICTIEGVDEFKEIAIFQDNHGLPEFRQAIANFMGKVRGNKVKFDPDRIVMSGGATGAHEMIAFCLADPGEAFLVPTPYHPGFDKDLRWRTRVQLVPVHCDSSNDFKITRPALEEAYKRANEDNIKVKGLLITNPSDRETLKGIWSFIHEKNIHLVCDEIYATTVFSQPGFVSISEVLEEDPKCNRDLVHVVYSLSKDMGFPGFRVGIVYSYNDAVVGCAREMSSFGLVSSETQHLIASMLSDDQFVDKFIAESTKRLAARYKVFTEGLEEVNTACLNGSAGLFFWMDLRHLLKEPTVAEEMALWRIIIQEVKLNVSPGSSFHCTEPGWFWVCFANMDEKTMDVALQRIRSFVVQAKKPKVPAKEKCLQEILGSASRRHEDWRMPSWLHT
ncbi:Aminotransferase, class I/classII [Dillenia turbinata]|uniref:1-aminocyclopropane-1-carboxylate synthase n=1 Tax=Dillenia turbinata TaxID=194707 RepID=A0AAN8VSV7_9MAGN